MRLLPLPLDLAPAPAEAETRFRAAALDRGLGWSLGLVVTLLLLARAGRWEAREAVPAGLLAVLVCWAASAVALGRTGRTPGRVLTGVRLLDERDGRPIGVRRAVAHALVGGLAGAPSGGLGLVLLALSALTDPTGRRRTWHDRWVGAQAVAPGGPAPDPVGGGAQVNLTTRRLAPAPAGRAPAPPSAPPAPPQGGRRWLLRCADGSALRPDPEARLGRLALRVTEEGDLVVRVADAVPDGVPALLVRGTTTRPLALERPTTLRPGDALWPTGTCEGGAVVQLRPYGGAP